MKLKRLYSCNTSFLDLLFNMLLAFVGLFVLSFALMNQNKKSVEIKAAFLITVTWPVDFNDDVDTYVEDSDGHIIFFGRREDGLMHLDRDDLGHLNDTVMTQFGPVTYNENKEVVTLRGISPGEYCVNVHAYKLRDPRPVEVTVQLEKVTPIFTTVIQKKVTLLADGDERTAFRFEVNSKNEVVSISGTERSIIQAARNPKGFNAVPNAPVPDPEFSNPPSPLPADIPPE